jgi:translocation and assembly module TamB
LKISTKKILLISACVIVVVAISAIAGLMVYVSSPAFKETARQYALRAIEDETGGSATLGRLNWNWWTQRVSLFDITVHGTEPADGSPLVHIESIEAGVNFRSLLKRRLDLFELTVTRPEFHLFVDEKGNTNLPNPQHHDVGKMDYQLSIENFKVAQGTAFVNERQINIDFVMKNLDSELSYQGANRIMTAHVSYDGVLERLADVPIPYSLSSDFDFTRDTLLTKHVVVSTGKSRLQLQGRINDVLTSKIAGKLDYSGNAAFPFLNYFFPKENFSGESAIAGNLEFSPGSFHTLGNAKGSSIRFGDWSAGEFRGDYDYLYPEKRLTVDHLFAAVFGGTTEGKVTVVSLPGPSRISLNLSYNNIDGTSVARFYPWEPKYRIESRIAGKVQGWFEGRQDRYEFVGDAALVSAKVKPEPGITSLPLDGSLAYTVRPGHADVSRANVRFLSTSVLADGTIDTDNFKLNVHMTSPDLSDLQFLYPDANGTGSFDGMLTGTANAPVADGSFDLRRYKYRDWIIEQADGMAHLDTQANTATLNGVRVSQGQSQILLNGTAALDGTKVDLRVQTNQLRAEDTAPFVKQQFGGVLSGAIHLTSLKPLRFDGDVRAAGLVVNGQMIRDVRSHVQYEDPAVSLQNLSASDGGSTLTGRASYNLTSEAMTFTVHIVSVNFDRLRKLGLPEAVEGVIQQADLTGSGTRTSPEIDGTARLQDLSFHGEKFPTARVDVDSNGTRVNLKISETRDLDLTAQIDTAGKGYPFTAEAAFRRYSIEQLAGFSRGTLTVSGNASLKGSLSDIANISGTGQINPIDIVVQNQTLHSTKPFAFDFNSERLNVTDVSLVSSTGPQMNLSGTIGLTPGAKLNLRVTGQVDAGLLASNSAWNIGGTLNVSGQVGGTVAKPDLQGQASFMDLSIARQGVSTSLTALKGDVIFDQHRMTLSNVEGHSNGGLIRIQGTGAIEGDNIGALNLRVNATSVRLRYPKGMRSVVDGSLAIGGTMAAPSISGDIQIQSLTLNSNFDDFIAMFGSVGEESESPSPFGNVQLALRVVGNRNISIHNELATAEARIDLGIKGTLDNPALTGHVESNNGTMVFQGRKYDVTRGNIDFVNPVRIDPSIDIQAETSIRNYQVFLSISGRMNHLQLNMRSEPALPQLEIVNLISGGKTTDEYQQSAQSTAALEKTPTGEQAFQGGAASILSDMLVSRVGSKFNLMGLERIVRIDPFVVGAQNSTTARITLSQQVTKDLSVTYSRDLTSNKQQIVQIEYFITKNISVLASKDEEDVLALDLRLRKRF